MAANIVAPLAVRYLLIVRVTRPSRRRYHWFTTSREQGGMAYRLASPVISIASQVADLHPEGRLVTCSDATIIRAPELGKPETLLVRVCVCACVRA